MRILTIAPSIGEEVRASLQERCPLVLGFIDSPEFTSIICEHGVFVDDILLLLDHSIICFPCSITDEQQQALCGMLRDVAQRVRPTVEGAKNYHGNIIDTWLVETATGRSVRNVCATHVRAINSSFALVRCASA